MARKFSELFDKMPPESQRRAMQIAEKMRAEMPLALLREAQQMTQESLAEALDIGQAAVSRIEHRTDAYVSTLRRYVEALGGELVILARFREGEVRITQFEDIAGQKAKRAQTG